MLTIKEYAEVIANAVNGTVKEVEKANGVIMTGIEVPTADNVKAVFYVDKMYRDRIDTSEAIKTLLEKVKTDDNGRRIDVDFITDFEQVKPRLKARLYNKLTKVDVYRSAAEYGFDDLIISAAVTVTMFDGSQASIKVNNQMLKSWNVTAEEVLQIAEDNARKAATITSMFEYMKSLGQIPPFMTEDDVPPMHILTNADMSYGAYSIIAKLDELKAMFPNGFYMIPSSVHEVLVVDVPADPSEVDSMVQDVNMEYVNPEEVLSNHAYKIAA